MGEVGFGKNIEPWTSSEGKKWVESKAGKQVSVEFEHGTAPLCSRRVRVE